MQVKKYLISIALILLATISFPNLNIHASQRAHPKKIHCYIHRRQINLSNLKHLNTTIKFHRTYGIYKKETKSNQVSSLPIPHHYNNFDYTQKSWALKPYNTKNYHVLNDNYQTVASSQNERVPNKRVPITLHTYDGVKTVFKTYKYLPFQKKHHKDSLTLPESLAITPDANWAFISYDAHADRMNNGTGNRYPIGSTAILRVNLQANRRSHHLKLKNGTYKIGPVFNGGHGQALAYNPSNNQLWLLNNVMGTQNPDSAEEIDMRTLKPIRRVNFKFWHIGMGDILAFDDKGKAYNARIERSNFTAAPQGSLRIYLGKVTAYGLHFRIVKQGIRDAPAGVLQAMAYDPKSKCIYFVGDDVMVSIPIKAIGHLKNNQLKRTWFGNNHIISTNEFEGFTFSKHGRAFLLLNRTPQILMSTQKF